MQPRDRVGFTLLMIFLVLGLFGSFAIKQHAKNMPRLKTGNTFMIRLQNESSALDSGNHCVISESEYATILSTNASPPPDKLARAGVVSRTQVMIVGGTEVFAKVRILTAPIDQKETGGCQEGTTLIVPTNIAERSKRENWQ